jgi:hypothetical protein
MEKRFTKEETVQSDSTNPYAKDSESLFWSSLEEIDEIAAFLNSKNHHETTAVDSKSMISKISYPANVQNSEQLEEEDIESNLSTPAAASPISYGKTHNVTSTSSQLCELVDPLIDRVESGYTKHTLTITMPVDYGVVRVRNSVCTRDPSGFGRSPAVCEYSTRDTKLDSQFKYVYFL